MDKGGKYKLWQISRIPQLGEQIIFRTAFSHEMQRAKWITMCKERKRRQNFAFETWRSGAAEGVLSRLELVNMKL